MLRMNWWRGLGSGKTFARAKVVVSSRERKKEKLRTWHKVLPTPVLGVGNGGEDGGGVVDEETVPRLFPHL